MIGSSSLSPRIRSHSTICHDREGADAKFGGEECRHPSHPRCISKLGLETRRDEPHRPPLPARRCPRTHRREKGGGEGGSRRARAVMKIIHVQPPPLHTHTHVGARAMEMGAGWVGDHTDFPRHSHGNLIIDRKMNAISTGEVTHGIVSAS